MHLFGAWGVRLGGDVTLHGRPYAVPTPRDPIARGAVLTLAVWLDVKLGRR